jgi:hypothetical protein
MIAPKLIQEADYWFRADKDQIEKSREKHNGKLIMETCLQRADVKNQMGRTYPKEILEREFTSYQKLVDGRYAYGALDHTNSSVIELTTASHIVSKQQWKRNEKGQLEWWGELEVLSNSPGKELAAIIESGARVSVSSRGVGSVEYDKSKDQSTVQSDFIIIAFDAVGVPSTHNANLILKEALDLHKNKDAYKRYLEMKIQMLNDIDLRKREFELM